jgi:hypothetical protein
VDDDELVIRKSVAFYAAGVTAWHASARGACKSLFNLSAGGIGLLVALLATVGAADWLTFGLAAAAMASLLVTLLCVLAVSRRQQAWIEKAIAGGTVATGSDGLERAAVVAFALGALLIAGAGIAAGWQALQAREAEAAATRLQLEFTRNLLRAGDAAGGPVPATATPAASAPPAR